MRRLLFVTLAIACACGAPATPTKTVTLLRLGPPAKTVDAAQATPPPADVCTRVMNEQRAKLTRAMADERRQDSAGWKDVTDDEMLALLPPPNGVGVTCLPFPGGAWALEIATLSFFPQWRSFEAHLAATLYVGKKRAGGNEPVRTGYGAEFTTATMSLASDYDGDGVPELYVHTYEDGVEGGHSEESFLYTRSRDAVTIYAPAASLAVIGVPRDVDGDGRLDLPTSAGIHLEGSIECQGKADWDAASFLAHALPDGSFSTNDAVAKKFARAWCPAPPTKASSVLDALCMRLWASTPKPVNDARRVVASCVPWDCNLEFEDKPQPKGASADCEPRRNAFESNVPFTLP